MEAGLGPEAHCPGNPGDSGENEQPGAAAVWETGRPQTSLSERHLAFQGLINSQGLEPPVDTERTWTEGDVLTGCHNGPGNA